MPLAAIGCGVPRSLVVRVFYGEDKGELDHVAE